MTSMESVNPSSVLPSPTSSLVLTENKIKQKNHFVVFVAICIVKIVATLEVTLTVTVVLI
jgi:hypothetical protein